MKRITGAICLLLLYVGHSQTTMNPNTGDAYLLFGPNSSWGEYLKVGGNGRVTTNAGIFATNGNLHLDAKNGPYSIYLNHYSQGNTLLNTQGGKVGIGTTSPDAKLTVKGDIHAQEVKVNLNVPAPDYVLKEDYNLRSLQEVQDHIQKHGHFSLKRYN